MTDKKISEETAATALTGTELFGAVQGGANAKVTVDQIRQFLGGRVIAQSGASASHTGDTIEATLATITLPAGVLGPNGRLEIDTLWTFSTSSANSKTCRAKLSTAVIAAVVATTSLGLRHMGTCINRNSQSAQIIFNPANQPGSGTSAVANSTAAIDTSVSQTITITGQLASAAETITLEGYTVRAIYGA